MSEMLANVVLPAKKLQFVRIPQQILYAPLRPMEKLALGVVCGFSDHAMVLTNLQLSQLLGCRRPETVSRLIRRLEKDGWIAIQRVGAIRLVRWQGKPPAAAPLTTPPLPAERPPQAEPHQPQPTAHAAPPTTPDANAASACTSQLTDSLADQIEKIDKTDCADRQADEQQTQEAIETHPFAGLDCLDVTVKTDCPDGQDLLTAPSTKKEKKKKRNISLSVHRKITPAELQQAEKLSLQMVQRRIAELALEVDPRQFYAFYRRWPMPLGELDRKLTSWHINRSRRQRPAAAAGAEPSAAPTHPDLAPTGGKTIAQLAAEYQTLQAAALAEPPSAGDKPSASALTASHKTD